MPKNKFQDIVFTLIMVVVMVYAMVIYNISLDMGKLTNQVFPMIGNSPKAMRNTWLVSFPISKEML